MKLFLIIDSPKIEENLKEILNSYPTIKTHFNIIEQNIDIENIKTKIIEINPFLILTFTNAQFTKQYIDSSKLINLINNYGSNYEKELLNNAFNIQDVFELNTVNRNTVFFDVFLEIPKGVSVSENTQLEDLKRVDTVSNSNFILSSIFQQLRKQYYILNYSHELKNDDVIHIFEHLN